MRKRFLIFRPTRRYVTLMSVVCLLAFTQVACDRDDADTVVEQTGESSPAESVQPIVTDSAESSVKFVSAGQIDSAVAPGNIVVMALSSADARAVIKSAAGEMLAMKPGDVVPGTETRLVDVLPDRLVFEEVVIRPSGLKVRQILWVYKAKNGVSRVQVLNRDAPELKEYKVTQTIVTSQ